MAVEENNIETPEVEMNELEPVDVEIKPEDDEGSIEETQETQNPQENFYENLAEDMDEVLLSRLANDLLADYKKDKESRSDWEKIIYKWFRPVRF